MVGKTFYDNLTTKTYIVVDILNEYPQHGKKKKKKRVPVDGALSIIPMCRDFTSDLTPRVQDK